MSELSNEAIVKQMYKDFSEKNMAAVLSNFDQNVIWFRPGSPELPYSGTFNGINEVIRMFGIITQSITLKTFIPKTFCTNQDTVVVLGEDEATVNANGKSYYTQWAQVFTFKDKKIIHVNVYMDTLAISKAFNS